MEEAKKKAEEAKKKAEEEKLAREKKQKEDQESARRKCALDIWREPALRLLSNLVVRWISRRRPMCLVERGVLQMGHGGKVSK